MDRRPLSVELGGVRRTLVTAGGIFSPAGVDKGTAVLLAEAPAPPAGGRLLDIGCGWGPIALSMALASPDATVYAVDVNKRAVTLTQENARTLNLSNVIASVPSAVDPTLEFDAIYSNPPIRVGKEELHSLLLLWLPRLKAGATALLVVQKNLGADSLQRWLAAELPERFENHGFSVRRASTSKSYRILEVTRA